MSCGIIDKSHWGSERDLKNLVGRAFRLQRKKYQTWLARKIGKLFKKQSREPAIDKFRNDYAAKDKEHEPGEEVKIRLVGVWDTVDAVGLPFDHLADFINGVFYRFKFPEYELHPKVDKGNSKMNSDNAEFLVLDLFHRIRLAMIANDIDVLKKYVGVDYTGSDANGLLHDREAMLAAYGPNAVKLESFEVAEVETKSWADTVLVSGLGWMKGSFEEHRFEHHLRFLDVYAKRKGTWKVVASHVTEIATA